MTSLILLAVLGLLAIPVYAQDETPVSWKVGSERMAPLTFRIKCEAAIKAPFHIYPQGSAGNGGIGMPTEFIFEQDANAEFVGPVKEKAGDGKEGETPAYYAGGVAFIQTVKLKSPRTTTVSFVVKYMACTDVMCLPPTGERFTVVLEPGGSGQALQSPQEPGGKPARQQANHSIAEFMQIDKVEDQEKYYDRMLAEGSAPADTNNYRAELAVNCLARGNLERYRHYKATDPRFAPRHLIYLCEALEKLADTSNQYAAVAQISRELLDDLDKGTLRDGVGKAQVLMELNAVSNARLGNLDTAREMIARSSQVKDGMREAKYFRDSTSSYLNRQAIVLSAAGDHQAALDMLTTAFREADSNPNMDATFMEVYRKARGTSGGAEELLAALRREAYLKYYKEVESTYIEAPQKLMEGALTIPSGKKMTLFRSTRPVHDISLVDLSGRTVHLGDHKGKVLALDFWSTTCTPCVAAFAGFDRVVDDYSKSQFRLFVVGLFEDEATVASFVARKGITLDVLRDQENLAYDVKATPTKIVFDPAGNIRFYAMGYAGSTDREYYKLKAMVEIIKARQ